MLFRELHPIPPLDVSSIRCIQYPVSYFIRIPPLTHSSSNAFSTRLLNFQISLYTLLLNIIVLIPVSLCVVSTAPLNSGESPTYIYRRSPTYFETTASLTFSRRRVLLVLAPLSVYFFLLPYVPLPGVILSEENRTFTLITARYNVLGTVILGSLSGFGSVTTAWGYFPLSCCKNRHVNQPSLALFTSITLRSLGRL